MRILCICMTIALYAAGPVICQGVQLTLPSAAGETAIFDAAGSLSVVTRTVPAGLMRLYPAYDGDYADPVVIVEGFDPLNDTLPADVYAMVNVLGGIDGIRSAGRSVWIVNFGDGAGAIAANAALVSSAVQQASNYGGLADARVDVLGLSMGGVIARYALAADEQNAGPTDGIVGLYISGDSPQQGANVNPSVQEFALMLDDPAYTPLISADAALSMMYVSVRGYDTNGCIVGALPDATAWTGSTAAHDWFYNRLNSLNGDGYPHKARKVAVSNGSSSPQPYPVGSQLFAARTYATWPWRFQVCSETYGAYAADVAAGSLGNNFTPGTIRETQFELDQMFVPTFIPTESALDIRGGVSMFDRVVVQTTAQDHGAITSATNSLILEELLGAGRAPNPKLMPDGATAGLPLQIVSAVYADRFYIGQQDRAWGIAVVGSTTVTEGDLVDVLGGMSTSGVERVIQAGAVDVVGTTLEVAPLALRLRDLGGGPHGPYTGGVDGGTGLNTIGLLVRCAGRVAFVAPDESYFHIDDGAKPLGSTEGIRISLANPAPGRQIEPPEPGRFVCVTGACSAYSDASGIRASIRPRRAADIHYVP